MVVTSSHQQLNQNRQTVSGEQRVVFNGLKWSDYLAILAAVGDNRSSRLTYDRGKLEITMPLEKHEFSGEMIARFILILVEELGLNLKSMGSTTLNYPELDRGAEPDKEFYIQNASLVTGREVDLEKDPPPDLVVEVDITNTDIDKLRLYAAMGIPEFWRYDGDTLRIYRLVETSYQEAQTSPTFPKIEKDSLYQFLVESKENEVQASRNLRKRLQDMA